MADNQHALAASVLDLASGEMKPGDLYKAVRKKHPSASKKDIVRAAFRALLETKADHQQSRAIHDMAVTNGPSLNGHD